MKQQLIKHPLQRLLYNNLGHTTQNTATLMKHIAKLPLLALTTTLLPISPASAEVDLKLGFANVLNHHTVIADKNNVFHISRETSNNNYAMAADSSNYLIAQSDLDSALDNATRDSFKECVDILNANKVQIESGGETLGNDEMFAICEHSLYVTDRGVDMLRTGEVSVNNPSNPEPSDYGIALSESKHISYTLDFIEGLSAEKAQSYELSSSFQGLPEEVAVELYKNTITLAAYVYSLVSDISSPAPVEPVEPVKPFFGCTSYNC